MWYVGVWGVLVRVLHQLLLCVGDWVCWCPCMCVPEGLLPPLWVGGVGVLVVCYLGRYTVVVWWCGARPLLIIIIHNYSKNVRTCLQCSKCVATNLHDNNKEQTHVWVALGLAPLWFGVSVCWWFVS